MLTKVLGWFWITIGIIFLLKPEILKRRMQRKSAKKLKKFMFMIAVTLGTLLIVSGWKFPGGGVLSKIIIIFGIIGIIKGFFFLKTKAIEKIVEWYSQKPLIFYRISASVHVLIGVVILLSRR